MDSYKIGIIGVGNVGSHLARAFAEITSNEIYIYSRSSANLEMLGSFHNIKRITSIHKFENDLDFIFLTVQDDQIARIARKLKIQKPFLLHTSGGVSLKILTTNYKGRSGVFYPLQTFKSDIAVDYKEIPVLVESKRKKDLPWLEKIAKTFSGIVIRTKGKDRKKIHLAAVMVNNFANHLYDQSFAYLKKNKVDPEILLPLIRETAKRLEFSDPHDLQTGPARRNDEKVIKEHLKALSSKPDLKKLYRLFSDSISKNHKV